MSTMPLTRHLLPALACLLLTGGAQAQQQPLTGQMLGGGTPAAPASQPLQSESLATVDLATPPAPVPQAAYAPQPQAHVPHPSQPQSAQRPPHHRDFDDSDFGKHGRQGYRKPKSWLSEIFD